MRLADALVDRNCHWMNSYCANCKDVNEYLNRYLNIHMGIRILFEYSMVNDINFFPP